MRKKILIIQNKNPFSFKGGVEVGIKEISLILSKKYKIFIVCRGKEEKTVNNNGITIFERKIILPIGLADFEYAIKINNLTRELNPDLIIDNGSLSFLNNTKKYKTISIAHGTNHGNYLSINPNSIENVLRKIYRLFWSKVQKNYLSKCYKVIAVSEKVKKEIENFYKITKNKIIVIDNGTMINISKSEEIKILKKPIKRNIIFISTAHEWKGIRILEKIAQRLKNYNFFVCGYDYKPNLKNVKYLGLLNEGGLKKAIYNSDVFIFPSQYEGQSLAILDSLAMGLPIIISKESDPIIAKNGENGFIIKNRTDISEYIKKIDFLFSNPELIQSMKAKNIELMRNYTWKKQGGKYLKLVREII